MEAAGMPEQVEQKARSELARLRQMQPFSPEATVVRNYLDWLVSLPWSKRTEDRLDIVSVQRILDEDHYGLEKPKERIVEHLAVVQLAGRIKGPVLCLVGPPGTGKTSLARSVARALGRNFVRVSLGGIRDEAEIRGHRRTYVGALPGRIIQSMRRAGSKNPVFLMDEVDKIGADFRGDPAAALLEVLDPEQSHSFSDHYLEVEFDLSEVLFITTANTPHTIPPPLLDRMEVIELHGYLEHEKLHIAKGFLIPKQLKETGIDPSRLRITDGAIVKLIRQYTDEAGVRQLQREIASICRKVARRIVEGKEEGAVTVTARDVEGLLGIPRVEERKLLDKDLVGVATGLAWTQNGGDLLQIEVTLFPGKGELVLTGRLGEVMKESAQAAWSYVRAAVWKWGIEEEAFRHKDVHIHVPEGAIPKDGPSAGITMATALVSALTGRPVRRDVAMSGEVTLRGHVLPVGGLNEKVLAARRAGVRTVVLPKRNEPQVRELPPELRRGMNFVLVMHMDEVLKVALVDLREVP
ncbi:MAG TPA: endopeptidase La [Candidatus Latescibacteria bacterium]|nr:endopeptidase La [Candidatus Latescibacterota bacterium]